MTATASAQDTRLAPVGRALQTTGAELLTFDVFDTLVFRRVDRPVDAFAFIGRRLREEGHLRSVMTPAMFGAVRREAEGRARQRRHAVDGSQETDLHGIYDCFPTWPLESGVSVEELVAAEVDVERGLLVADLDVVAFLDGAKAEGRRIAAVSDSYFREATLREVLRLPRLGPLLEDIEFFVSCELGVGKGSGLWGRTAEFFGVPAHRIVHFGDNPVDDVEKARACGVAAFCFSQRDESLAAIELQERRLRHSVGRPQPLEWRSTDPTGLRALRGKVAGAAEHPRDLEPFWRYGATMLGPVLSGFAQWVAREATERGVSRLACLMREGALLAELIGAAGAAEGVDLRPVPTWINRQVGLAATLGGSEDDLDRLLHGRSGLTVVEALRLLGLGLEDLPALRGQARTRLYDPTVRAAFLEGFREDAVMREKAAAHARVLSGRIVEVLEGETDSSGRLWLVDLGWGASIQQDVAEILKACGSDISLTGYYLMTNANAGRRAAGGLDVRSFLLDAGSNQELVDLIMRSPEVIEQVTCDLIGTQIGLDDRLAPVTAPLDSATRPQRLQARAVREGIRDFHRSWLRYRAVVPRSVPSLADAQFELVPILLRTIVAPTVEEARLFGGWHHDEGRGSAREDALISVDHERLVTHAAPDELQKLPMQQLYWPAGLVAQHAPEEAPLYQLAASGLIPWTSLSAPAGKALLNATDAAAEHAEPSLLQPLRTNRRGNVLINLQAVGADLNALELRLCQGPHVIRLDSLDLRLWEQGAELPRLVRLAAADLPLQVPLEHYVTVGHNVFAARAPGAGFAVDLHALREQVIYRVEVLAAFGLLATPGTLGGRIPFESERVERLERTLADVKSSASWRLTRPMRRVVQATRRLS